jgi:hypothetical protein
MPRMRRHGRCRLRVLRAAGLRVRTARGVAVASYNPTVPDDDDSLERAIAGALRAAIKDHGPITADKIGSAVKRIMGNLPNAKASGLAAALGRRRWSGLSAEEQRAQHSSMAKSMWANMTAEERAAFLKKRGEAIKKGRRRASSSRS